MYSIRARSVTWAVNRGLGLLTQSEVFPVVVGVGVGVGVGGV